MDSHAVIVAGGRGERMKSLGADSPKPMLAVAGKPVLEHQVLWLKRAGFSEAVLCLGYKAEVVQAHFGDGSRWGLRLRYAVEDRPLGTAGAVKKAASGLSGDLLVLYGDIYLDMQAAPLLDFHRSHDGAATVVVRESDHPMDSDLVTLGADGRVTGFPGRAAPGKPFVNLTCAAVWVVRPRILALVPDGRSSDWAKDVFPAALAKGERLYGYKTDEVLADIGTPERYKALQERLRAPRLPRPPRGDSA